MAALSPDDLRILNAAALAWGVGVGVTLWSIYADVAEWRKGRKPKRERRFIEPCADSMHAYEEGVCGNCKQPEPTDSTD